MHTGEALGAKGRFIWFLSGLSLFLLYGSGLLRWLCRTGKVRDRDVNFAALLPLLHQLRKGVYRLIFEAYLLSRLLVNKASDFTPYIKIGYGMLLKGFRRILVFLRNNQKRLGKK